MKTLFTNLMAAWLLVLAITGWCCQGPFGRSSALTSGGHAQCACQCSNCTSRPSQSQAPSNAPKSCQGICKFVPAARATVDESQLAAVVVSTTYLAPSSVCPDVAAGRVQGESHFSVGPPVALHLLHLRLDI